MDGMRQEFAQSKQRFQSVLAELSQASVNHPELAQPITELKQLETRYFSEADLAMDNYQAMFAAQASVQSRLVSSNVFIQN